jgi:CheY-like chemotaxis protein
VVLIIADDPLAREVYGELFGMRGHRVETVSCARAGLSRLAQREDVSVVVLALDGAGVTAPLRRRLHELAPRAHVHVLGLPPQALYEPTRLRQQLH